MSDTPRTDAFKPNWENPGTREEWINFARQLERENAELKAEILKCNELQGTYEGVNLLYFADMVEENCCPLIRALIGSQ